MERPVVEINTENLACLIMKNSDCQLSSCYVSANEDGCIYFAQETEPVGDDVVLFNFRYCDMDMGDAANEQDVIEMVDWLKNDLDSESDPSDNFKIVLI